MQISKKLRNVEHNGLSFYCLGCRTMHMVNHGDGGWEWNGDVNAPTFSPSIKVTSGHHMPNHNRKDNCWCIYNAEQIAKGEEPSKFKCTVCHFFIKHGVVEFLSDCTHPLAGQTMPLPDLPDVYCDSEWLT